jgi:hypothetical protein
MQDSKADRKAGKARAAKAHAAWLASPAQKAQRKKALADNAKLCMGAPSGAQFPCSPDLQMKFAKRFRRNFFSVVDKYNADQAAKDDAAWNKLQQDNARMQACQPKLKA